MVNDIKDVSSSYSVKSNNSKKQSNKDNSTGGFEALLSTMLRQNVNSPGNNSKDKESVQPTDDSTRRADRSISNEIKSLVKKLNQPDSDDKSVLEELKKLVEELEGMNGDNSSADIMQSLDGSNDSTNPLGLSTGNSLIDEIIKEVLEESAASKQGVPDTASQSMEKLQKILELLQSENSGAPAAINVDTKESNADAKAVSVSDSQKAQSMTVDNVLKAKQAAALSMLQDSNAKIEVKQQSQQANQASDQQNISSQQQSDENDGQLIIMKPEIIKIVKGLDASQKSDDTKNENVQGITDDAKKAAETKMVKNAGMLDNEASNPEQEKKAADSKNAFQILTDSIKSGDNKSGSIQKQLEQVVQSGKDPVMDQIYEKLKVLNNSDVSELRISLRPDELGQVNIKLVMEKGMMVGKIMVENEQVKNLIESSLPQMKENLKHQNLNVTEFNVSVGSEPSSQMNYQNQEFSERWYTPERKVSANRVDVPEMDQVQETIKNVQNNGAVNILA